MNIALKELGKIITGNTPSKKINEFWDSADICFVKPDIIADSGVNYIESSNEYISEEARLKARVVKKDTIFVTCIGSIGKVGIAASGEYAFNQQINAIVPNEKVIPKYLAYNILYNRPKLVDIANAPVVPIINKSQFGEFELNIESDVKQQKYMIDVLDKVSDIIALRKVELEGLDNLIKARFVEMFGDPIRNTQNRSITDFINVVKMQRGFDLPVQDRQQDGNIPVFGSNGALDHHDVAKVQGGGVITGRSGTIGKVYYTEGDYWPLNTSLFSVDTHGNNIVYLAYLLQMYDLSRFTEGTGVPTLNRNKFHDKPIIDVPLNEQEEFAVFVRQVDKSKVVVQKALDEAQLLFDSLMQEYFG